MKTYPIMLDVRRRPAVVIGAGAVGRRKARALAQAGAKVTLIDPNMPPGAAQDAGRVELLARQYQPAQLDGAFLVFACTPDRDLNKRIVADARRAGALANAADQPEDCDFFAPAVIRNGDVVVAIATGGAAPALAAMLKGKLKAACPPGLGRFAKLLGELKDQLKTQVPQARRRAKILRQLACDRTLEDFRTGGARAVRDKLRRILSGGRDRPKPKKKPDR